MRRLCMLSILLWGCASTDADEKPVDDETKLEPAPLAELSDGDCPDMSVSGTSFFSSGGLERKVSVVIPKGRPENAPVIFTFHGLVPSDYDPVSEMVAGFDLQAAADELGAIFITPESRVTELPGVGSLLLWGILDDAEPDLVLFDDLRTCVANELGADVFRFSAWGHSGGALWTTVLVGARSLTLATALEFSGGAELTIPLMGGPFVTYEAPEWDIPVLLASGGSGDVWPDPTFILVNFEEATDTLTAGLQGDGHTVVRCKHSLGHFSFPNDGWIYAQEWLSSHRFAEPSGVLDGTIPAPPNWCELLAD